MDFKLTEEQELMLESLRELIARESPEEYVKECDGKGLRPDSFIKALVDNGFAMLGVPEEYGGTPADLVTMMLVVEEITKQGAPHNTFSTALQIHNMLNFGSPEQIGKTMELSKEGRQAFCLGFTEPQAGSDSNMIATTYTRKDGKVYINGQKTFITGALIDPYMLCMARDPEVEDPKKAFTMWWIDMKKAGIKVNPIHKIGWNMIKTCEVYLDNVELEEKDMVGKEGMGFMHLMQNFEVERMVMAAYILGMAECAFGDAAKYANQRVQFGKPIGANQLIQEKITNMAIKIENMKNMLYHAAWKKDNNIPVQIDSAMVKLYCCQAGNEVIDDALQIFGGIGYTNDCRVSRLWRDARVYRIGGGTDEVMIHIAGRSILKQYR